MKIKTTIEELNQNDLVDLLSTSLSGSTFLACDYSRSDYKRFCVVNDEDCIEDAMAKLLLAGLSIRIGDMYAEDDDEDNDSKLPHKYELDDGIMWYDVTLEDIKRGVETCLNGEGDGDNTYLRSCAMDFINGEGDMDLPEAEAIMQVILWGELIYG